jgi:hypothetical protein
VNQSVQTRSVTYAAFQGLLTYSHWVQGARTRFRVMGQYFVPLQTMCAYYFIQRRTIHLVSSLKRLVLRSYGQETRNGRLQNSCRTMLSVISDYAPLYDNDYWIMYSLKDMKVSGSCLIWCTTLIFSGETAENHLTPVSIAGSPAETSTLAFPNTK